jgi:predicted HTH domain antitoxin
MLLKRDPHKARNTAKRVQFDLELPEELVAQLREDEIARKVREAFVMELLREHRVSQGKAAEVLNVSRNEIFDLMTNYRVPVIDLDTEELGNKLRKTLPRL